MAYGNQCATELGDTAKVASTANKNETLTVNPKQLNLLEKINK